MAKEFNFTCTEPCSSFEKHESCYQLILLTLFMPFQLFSFCFVVDLIFFPFFLPLQQGGSQPSVAHQFSMEQQELDHSLGISAGSSERSIRQSIKEGCVLTAAHHYQH